MKQKIERLRSQAEAAQDWMREPDFTADFGTQKIVKWLNSRPTHVIPALLSHIDALEARVARDKVPMDFGTANDGPKAIELSPPTSLRRLGTRAEAAERALEEAVKVLRAIDGHVSHGRMGDWSIALNEIRKLARATISKSTEGKSE